MATKRVAVVIVHHAYGRQHPEACHGHCEAPPVRYEVACRCPDRPNGACSAVERAVKKLYER